MDYLRNHCWCSDSNWGGNFDCQIIVSLNHYESDAYKEDWNNLLSFTKQYLEDNNLDSKKELCGLE